MVNVLEIANVEVKEIIENYAKQKGLLVGYADTSGMGIPLGEEYVCLYDENFKKDFEYYELNFGNFVTISKHDEQHLSIMLSSNDHPKEVMRRLKDKYELECVVDSYDQLFAPHWEFIFIVSNEKILIFLHDLTDLQKDCSNKETDMKMVYSVENTKRGIHVKLTEKNDWEAFGEDMGEHYHASIVKKLKDKGLKITGDRSDASFYCDMTKEAVLYVLEKEENMVFDESFDTYMKEYRQKYMKDELI